MGGWPHSSTLGGISNLCICSPQVLPPLCVVFQLMWSPWCPGSLLLSWHLRCSGCYPQSSIPHCYMTLFNFLTRCTTISSPPTHDSAPLFPPFPPLFFPRPSHLLFLIILFYLLSRTETYTLWSSFLLSFILSVSCIVGIPHSV
jgi:4-amino-4-deoxy-L-arabinose transferase-like glycosyltransferase